MTYSIYEFPKLETESREEYFQRANTLTYSYGAGNDKIYLRGTIEELPLLDRRRLLGKD